MVDHEITSDCNGLLAQTKPVPAHPNLIVGAVMLWILASILLVLWLIGLIEQPLGGFIHVLLLLAMLAAGTELALAWRRNRLE